MGFIEKKELTFGRSGGCALFGASVLMRVFGLNRINQMYDRVVESSQDEISAALQDLGASYEIHSQDIENIPSTGGVIFIANHPTGVLDGVVLIDALSKIRPDVKFMGNFLLSKIDFFSHHFIAVDPFDSPDRGVNLQGIKRSLEHVKGGGALVVFPAGEVATWQKGFREVKDKKWGQSVMKFIKRCEVPVVPLFIDARNSTLFRLMGKIHPALRTAMLPHEFLNKKGAHVMICAGTPILPKRVATIEKMEDYSDYLRASVDYQQRQRRKRFNLRRRPKFLQFLAEAIISPVPQNEITAELDAIRTDCLLFDHTDYDVYFAPSSRIPRILTEIGRLREVTFREVGEGSLKSIDLDKYDQYYHQLFVWDRTNMALVGAYRVGLGEDIVSRYGLKGFYTNSLFAMSPEMIPVMRETIELGRSFITKEYQRKSATLMLLWRGILYVLLQHEDYRNLLGPVTISGEFETNSKAVIVEFLRRHHYNHKLAKHIKPIYGLRGVRPKIDLKLIRNIDNIELINKLVVDIEHSQRSIPVLIKKYIQQNSRVLGFNVDPTFSDALDALMLLDLKKTPQDMIEMLAREIPDIDVVARFRKFK